MSKKLKNSPQEKAVVEMQRVSHSFSGPVPPPQILDGYNKIIPGAAERILGMAEADAKHQQNMDKQILLLASGDSKRGQIFGFLIAIAAFVTCIGSILLGSEKTAIVIGGTSVVGLVSVFITGRLIKEK